MKLACSPPSICLSRRLSLSLSLLSRLSRLSLSSLLSPLDLSSHLMRLTRS